MAGQRQFKRGEPCVLTARSKCFVEGEGGVGMGKGAWGGEGTNGRRVWDGGRNGRLGRGGGDRRGEEGVDGMHREIGNACELY